MKYIFFKTVFLEVLLFVYCKSINYERNNDARSRTFQVTENPVETIEITPRPNLFFNKQTPKTDQNQVFSVNSFQIASPQNEQFSNNALSLHYNSGFIALMINMLLKLYTIQKDGRFINDVRRNSPELLPSDPYIELLLSHYGKYLPKFSGSPKHFYSHITVNNLHNNQPFGNYKYVQDRND
ncbi:uncharacterized protein LOC123292800 [Chrysoperla carnea]|uniref:uncharacterized protein LOC123292800 n=1 Tax=Chrysoperla carnea TaxID=189513 RepID=UPI001D099511|nr:uncharacterized protein LOC123292800 [Chrysoperla carnea]